MFVIALLKILIFALRRFTSGSATALPGLILENYFPGVLNNLFQQLDEVVMITGTNGKTTTAKMLGHLLHSQGISFLANPSGSNMIRGLASTLLDKSDWSGKLTIHRAILEIEEGTMPKIVKLIKPKIIVVTNIFRDQLDAYGEIDKILSYLKTSVEIGHTETLILNADDQRVTSLATGFNGKVLKVGLAAEFLSLFKWENKSTFLKEADYIIKNLIVTDNGVKFTITSKTKPITPVQIQSVGPYDAFNATCALASGFELTNKWLPEELASVSPAFGRGEEIVVGETKYKLLLVKNPAGMNLNSQVVSRDKNIDALLLLLNDNIADGRDVSWIWDCDLGSLREQFRLQKKLKVYVGGTRAWDLALRLKYENIPVEKVFKNLDEIVTDLTVKYKNITVLPTYTAMMEFRKELGRVTRIKKIHE